MGTWLIRIGIAAVMVVLGVGLYTQAPLVTLNCTLNSQIPYTEIDEERCAPLAVQVRRSLYDWIGIVGVFAKMNSEAITAVSTIAIAVFTFTLWRTTREQLKHLGSSIELARAEFLASHRPKLILRGAYSFITDPLDTPITVNFSIANTGESRAWIVQSTFKIEIHAKGSLYVTPNSDGRNEINHISSWSPGEDRQLGYSSPAHVWDADHRRQWDKPHGVHFVGHLVYLDEPGSSIRRQLAFRRWYNRDTMRFERISETDNEYDYAD